LFVTTLEALLNEHSKYNNNVEKLFKVWIFLGRNGPEIITLKKLFRVFFAFTVERHDKQKNPISVFSSNSNKSREEAKNKFRMILFYNSTKISNFSYVCFNDNISKSKNQTVTLSIEAANVIQSINID